MHRPVANAKQDFAFDRYISRPDAEAFFLDALDRYKQGEAQTLNLIGPSGAGKTWLSERLRCMAEKELRGPFCTMHASIDDRHDDWCWLLSLRNSLEKQNTTFVENVKNGLIFPRFDLLLTALWSSDERTKNLSDPRARRLVTSIPLLQWVTDNFAPETIKTGLSALLPPAVSKLSEIFGTVYSQGVEVDLKNFASAERTTINVALPKMLALDINAAFGKHETPNQLIIFIDGFDRLVPGRELLAGSNRESGMRNFILSLDNISCLVFSRKPVTWLLSETISPQNYLQTGNELGAFDEDDIEILNELNSEESHFAIDPDPPGQKFVARKFDLGVLALNETTDLLVKNKIDLDSEVGKALLKVRCLPWELQLKIDFIHRHPEIDFSPRKLSKSTQKWLQYVLEEKTALERAVFPLLASTDTFSESELKTLLYHLGYSSEQANIDLILHDPFVELIKPDPNKRDSSSDNYYRRYKIEQHYADALRTLCNQWAKANIAEWVRANASFLKGKLVAVDREARTDQVVYYEILQHLRYCKIKYLKYFKPGTIGKCNQAILNESRLLINLNRFQEAQFLLAKLASTARERLSKYLETEFGRNARISKEAYFLEWLDCGGSAIEMLATLNILQRECGDPQEGFHELAEWQSLFSKLAENVPNEDPTRDATEYWMHRLICRWHEYVPKVRGRSVKRISGRRLLSSSLSKHLSATQKIQGLISKHSGLEINGTSNHALFMVKNLLGLSESLKRTGLIDEAQIAHNDALAICLSANVDSAAIAELQTLWARALLQPPASSPTPSDLEAAARILTRLRGIEPNAISHLMLLEKCRAKQAHYLKEDSPQQAQDLLQKNIDEISAFAQRCEAPQISELHLFLKTYRKAYDIGKIKLNTPNQKNILEKLFPIISKDFASGSWRAPLFETLELAKQSSVLASHLAKLLQDCPPPTCDADGSAAWASGLVDLYSKSLPPLEESSNDDLAYCKRLISQALSSIDMLAKTTSTIIVNNYRNERRKLLQLKLRVTLEMVVRGVKSTKQISSIIDLLKLQSRRDERRRWSLYVARAANRLVQSNEGAALELLYITLGLQRNTEFGSRLNYADLLSIISKLDKTLSQHKRERFLKEEKRIQKYSAWDTEAAAWYCAASEDTTLLQGLSTPQTTRQRYVLSGLIARSHDLPVENQARIALRRQYAIELQERLAARRRAIYGSYTFDAQEQDSAVETFAKSDTGNFSADIIELVGSMPISDRVNAGDLIVVNSFDRYASTSANKYSNYDTSIVELIAPLGNREVHLPASLASPALMDSHVHTILDDEPSLASEATCRKTNLHEPSHPQLVSVREQDPMSADIHVSQRGELHVSSVIELIIPDLTNNRRGLISFAMASSNKWACYFVDREYKSDLLRGGWFNSELKKLTGLKRITFVSSGTFTEDDGIEQDLIHFINDSLGSSVQLVQLSNGTACLSAPTKILNDTKSMSRFRGMFSKLFPMLELQLGTNDDWWHITSEDLSLQSNNGWKQFEFSNQHDLCPPPGNATVVQVRKNHANGLRDALVKTVDGRKARIPRSALTQAGIRFLKVGHVLRCNYTLKQNGILVSQVERGFVDDSPLSSYRVQKLSGNFARLKELHTSDELSKFVRLPLAIANEFKLRLKPGDTISCAVQDFNEDLEVTFIDALSHRRSDSTRVTREPGVIQSVQTGRHGTHSAHVKVNSNKAIVSIKRSALKRSGLRFVYPGDEVNLEISETMGSSRVTGMSNSCRNVRRFRMATVESFDVNTCHGVLREIKAVRETSTDFKRNLPLSKIDLDDQVLKDYGVRCLPIGATLRVDIQSIDNQTNIVSHIRDIPSFLHSDWQDAELVKQNPHSAIVYIGSQSEPFEVLPQVLTKDFSGKFIGRCPVEIRAVKGAADTIVVAMRRASDDS